MRKVKNLKALLEKYTQGIPDLREVEDCIQSYEFIDKKERRVVAAFNEHMEMMRVAILTEGDHEQSMEEELGEVPY